MKGKHRATESSCKGSASRSPWCLPLLSLCSLPPYIFSRPQRCCKMPRTRVHRRDAILCRRAAAGFHVQQRAVFAARAQCRSEMPLMQQSSARVPHAPDGAHVPIYHDAAFAILPPQQPHPAESRVPRAAAFDAGDGSEQRLCARSPRLQRGPAHGTADASRPRAAPPYLPRRICARYASAVERDSDARRRRHAAPVT